MTASVSRAHYAELLEARVAAPESLRAALLGRSRRSIPGADGRLVILAADHTARGILAAGDDPLAVADRFGIERAAAAITEVRDALGSWPEFAIEAGLSAAGTDAIAADFMPTS